MSTTYRSKINFKFLSVSRESFERIAFWIEEAKSESSEKTQFALIGNKADLVDIRQVSTEEGKQLAEKFGMTFLETSAKQNTNVKEMFYKAGLEIMRRVKNGGITIDEIGSEGVKRNKEYRPVDTEKNRARL